MLSISRSFVKEKGMRGRCCDVVTLRRCDVVSLRRCVVVTLDRCSFRRTCIPAR